VCNSSSKRLCPVTFLVLFKAFASFLSTFYIIDLKRLLEGKHSIKGEALTITLQPPKKKIPPDPFRVHVQGLSEKTTGDCLSFYLQKFSGDVEVEEVHFGPSNNALVVFKTEPGA